MDRFENGVIMLFKKNDDYILSVNEYLV